MIVKCFTVYFLGFCLPLRPLGGSKPQPEGLRELKWWKNPSWHFNTVWWVTDKFWHSLRRTRETACKSNVFFPLWRRNICHQNLFHHWSRLQAGSIKNMSEHLSPVWISPEEKPLMVYKWASSVRRLKHLDRTLTHYSLPYLFNLFIKFSLSLADPRYKVTKLRNLNLPHKNRQNIS